jgi:hypothetical protein
MKHTDEEVQTHTCTKEEEINDIHTTIESMNATLVAINEKLNGGLSVTIMNGGGIGATMKLQDIIQYLWNGVDKKKGVFAKIGGYAQHITWIATAIGVVSYVISHLFTLYNHIQ